MDYQLELKQIVDYPRCRIYRSFIRRLMQDVNIRTHGSSYLFYYIILCSFANFRTSNRRLVKFQITNWKVNNTLLEYNYPCQKDIVLDLWIHTIYNDSQVQGSDIGRVVYFRKHTGDPVINYRDLAEHWSISKATVSRLMKKLEEQQYLTAVSFTGTHGSVLYLQSYLSTMFSISDVMIDKEEVSLTFRIPITIKEESSMENAMEATINQEPVIRVEQITVPESENTVPKSHIQKMVRKVAGI